MPCDRELQLGDRVRLTVLGISRCPKIRSRTGIVASLPRSGSGSRMVGVLLDGNKKATTLHRLYVEFDDAV